MNLILTEGCSPHAYAMDPMLRNAIMKCNKKDWRKIHPSPSCCMQWSKEVEARLELRLDLRSLRSRLGRGDLWDR